MFLSQEPSAIHIVTCYLLLRVELSFNRVSDVRPNIAEADFHFSRVTSQQAQHICTTFVQRRPNIFDVGPTLYKCYTNVLCLLGCF